MDVQRIIAELDAEIAHLQDIRNRMSGVPGRTETATTAAAPKGRRGRPKGSKNAPKGTATAGAPAKTAKKQTKRKLSPEGRKAIADAMKRRWAERRKEAGK